MIKDPEDIQIIGAKGSIESKEQFLKRVSDFVTNSPMEKGMLLQFLNADLVCGRQHVQTALEHAQRAFQRGNAISDTLAMEILLYTAGEVQISSALAKIGIRNGCENVAVVAGQGIDIGALIAHLNLVRDDSVLECSETKLRSFGISPHEISAAGRDGIMELVLEKVAMVDVKK